MNRRRIGIMLIAAGLVLAGIAAVVVFVSISDAEAIRQNQPKRLVAVAKVDIPERTTISPDQIDIVPLPDQAIPPDAITAPADAPNQEALRQEMIDRVRNQFTPVRIYRGEVINKARLGQDALKNTPSFTLPQGKVAYPLPLQLNGGNPQNERMLIAFLYAVRPGDFVDVYYSSVEIPTGLSEIEESKARQFYQVNHLYTRRILQQIKVLYVGPFPDPEGKVTPPQRDERYITLELTPDQVLTLKWLKDAAAFTGNLEFVLRSPLDTGNFENRTINYEFMSQNFGIGTLR